VTVNTRARILIATGAAAGFAARAHLARQARKALWVTQGWLREARRAGRLPAPDSDKARTPG
jgi:hypothetical protein